MKNLHSTTEGVWLERKSTQLTEEQKVLLNSNDNEKLKRELLSELRNLNNVVINDENSAIAQGIYNDKKPILKDGDIYELIAVDIQLKDEGATGIINCRVNEEHIQVRF